MGLFAKRILTWKEPREFQELVSAIRKKARPKWFTFAVGTFFSLLFFARIFPETYSKGVPFRWDIFLLLVGFSFGLAYFLQWFEPKTTSQVEVFDKVIRRGNRRVPFSKITSYLLVELPKPIFVLFSGEKPMLIVGAPTGTTRSDLESLLSQKNIPVNANPPNLIEIITPAPFGHARLLSIFVATFFFVLLLGFFTIVLTNETQVYRQKSAQIAAQMQVIKHELKVAGVPKEKIKPLTQFDSPPTTPGFRTLMLSVPFLCILILFLSIQTASYYFDSKELKAKLEKKKAEDSTVLHSGLS